MIDCIVIGPNKTDFNELAKELKNRSNDTHYQDLRTDSVEYKETHYTCLDFMSLLLDKKFPGKYPKLDTFDAANSAVFLISSYLMEKGLKVDYVNNFSCSSGKDKLARLLSGEVRSVAITTTFYTDKAPFAEVVNFIRQHNKTVKIIAGGPMVRHVLAASGHFDGKIDTNHPLFGICDSSVDYFVIEEHGEKSLFGLVNALKIGGDISKEPNLWLKDGGKPMFTCVERENNDINKSFVDWRKFTVDTPRVVGVRTTIGCPHRCGFCQFRTIKYQTKSLDSLEKEFDSIYEAGIKNISFIDDTINTPEDRFKDILRLMIKNKYDFNWVTMLRCSDMSEEAYSLMKQSGCAAVHLGVESLDEQVLINMNKSDTDYLKSIKYLKKYEILTFTTFLVGYPGETKKTVDRTIKIFNENPADFWYPCIFKNLKGSYVFEERQKYGLNDEPFKWKHATMDHLEARSLRNKMIADIKNSYISPPYGGSMFNVPYLLSMNIPFDLIKKLYVVAGAAIKGNILNNNLREEEMIKMLD